MALQPGTCSHFDPGGFMFYSLINSVKTDTRLDLLCDQLCQERLQSRRSLGSILSRQIPE